MSSQVINTLSGPARLNSLERVELPTASLTLTRTAVLAVTTASITITWQIATRNNGFSWSATDITIPTSGYYAVQTQFTTNVNVTSFTNIIVNGIIIGSHSVISTARAGHSGFYMRYFTSGDILQFTFNPSAFCNINLNAINTFAESPFLHITQLTGVIP